MLKFNYSYNFYNNLFCLGILVSFGVHPRIDGCNKFISEVKKNEQDILLLRTTIDHLILVHLIQKH